MEAAGLSLAVVGLASQLFKASMDCYDTLSRTEDVATDHHHFVWQLNTEKHRLIKWGKAWGLTSEVGQKLDRSDYRYHYAVETLTRIASLFASADSLGTKYGIQAHDLDYDTTKLQPEGKVSGRHSRISWLPEGFSFRHRSRSPMDVGMKSSTPRTLPGLDLQSVRTLENLSLLEHENLAPDLMKKIDDLKNTTARLQKILPLYKKLRWVVMDKTRSAELIEKLKAYNDGLIEIFSDPEPTLPQYTLIAPQPFPKFNIPIQLPVQRNQYFRGREDLLEEIDMILNPQAKAAYDLKDRIGPTPKHQIAVLHGLGGIGKSQIAAEYAYRHYSDSSYTSVFWIDATSQASLAQSALLMIEQIISHYQTKWVNSTPDFVQIGVMLGLPGGVEPTGKIKVDKNSRDLVVKATKRWLSDPENKHWLIIFDNNDDIDSVKLHDFIPTLDFGHGSTIVTTRRFDIKHMGTGVEIDKIEKAAAISILLSSAGKATDATEDGVDYAEAANIAERLGYFPLALDQAGGYISAKQIPISSYLPLYTTNYKRVASKSHRGLAESYRNDTIFTTWKISFDSLPPPASELLLLCAFLGSGDIPEELLFRGRQAIPLLFEDDALADDALEPLLSISFAKRKCNTQTATLKLSFHPLVLEWARKSLDVSGQREYARRAVCLVGTTFGKGLDGIRTADEWSFGMRILTHIGVSLDNIRMIFSTNDKLDVGSMYAIRQLRGYSYLHGQYSNSDQIDQIILDNYQKCLGDEEPDVRKIEVNSGLAMVHRYQGYPSKALELYNEVLPIQAHLLGKEHPDTLTTMHKIGHCLEDLGRHAEAVELHEQILASQEKVLGKEHPSTLSTAHCMAHSLRRMEKYEESLELLKQVLAGREKTLGKEHPNTLDTMHNMGHCLGDMERYEEALELHQQILVSQEKVLGKEHPDTLRTANCTASSFSNLERYEEAVELYKLALAGRKKTLGEDHPDTLQTADSLAWYMDFLKSRESELEASGNYTFLPEIPTTPSTPEFPDTPQLSIPGNNSICIHHPIDLSEV